MADENQPLPINDMLPGVDTEKVTALLNDPNFKAADVLSKLNLEYTRRQKAGEDVSWLSPLMGQAYTIIMNSLYEQIRQSGSTQVELSGAFMVSQGMVRLPEKR